MKRNIMVYLMSSLTWTTSAQADERANIPSLNLREQSKATDKEIGQLIPGPFLAERAALLNEIKASEDKGIGIDSYLIAFQNIETMIKNNVAVLDIRVRLDSTRTALEHQLLQRKRSLPPALPNYVKQTNMMTLAAARLYMLNLVNIDRAKHHRSRLKLDFPSSAVAQSHCDEMAIAGYFSHWNLAGKKSWQQYSEAGGSDGIKENLASIGELGFPGKLQPASDPSFSPDDLQKMEESFMSERAPYDLHRVTLLAPEANKLGIGLSCAINSVGCRVCLVQEFVNAYGQFSTLPKNIVYNKPFEVAGNLMPGIKVYSVSVDWEELPKPMSIEELRATTLCSHGDYLMADISVVNEPESLKRWTKNGRQYFSVQITPSRDWKPGLYHVEILAVLPTSKEPFAVSTRTLKLLN